MNYKKFFRKFFTVIAILMLGVILGANAQTGYYTASVNMAFISTATSATCSTPTAGQNILCITANGTQIVLLASFNGAPYVQIAPSTSTAGAVATVNGQKPGPNGNVTVSCAPNSPTYGVTFSQVASGASMAGFVAAPVLTCAGTGS